MADKSNFDIIYEKIKTDPKFFGELCTNPEETLKKTGLPMTEGELKVMRLLSSAVVKGQTPAQLQDRMTAKGGHGGKHSAGHGS